MEKSIHTLRELFRQLGLPDDVASIEGFILTHRPLANEIHVANAPFWAPSQARFLREEIAKDGDWAELVDSLGSLLSR